MTGPDWQKELEELRRREAFAEELGGEERVKRQHDGGRLTIRERFAKLADPGTFHEIGKIAGSAQYDQRNKLSDEVSAQLRKQLGHMHILRPTLTERLRKPDTKWVQPHLTAKIAFRGITQDGKLRHPSFKGLKQGS